MVGGKILWVSTTPVPLAGTTVNSSCIDEYNAATVQLLQGKPDVAMLDLNGAVSTVCGKGYETCNLQRYRDVHFTDAGKQFCAIQVARGVSPLLAPKWNTLLANCSAGTHKPCWCC